LSLSFVGCQPTTGESALTEDDSMEEETDSQLPSEDTASDDSASEDTGLPDTGSPEEEEPCDPPVYNPDPFADNVSAFSPGPGAGFGQENFPNIVLGPPNGGGAGSGSLDVLSLGERGEIILEFTDYLLSDGPGVDLLVFENAFPGWPELGIVSASTNGTDWFTWSCESDNSEQGFPGCAGVTAVLSHPENCIDATDPSQAGGDGFDLSELGLETARFIKIQDTGTNPSGGFDLDAVSIVHGSIADPTEP